MPKPRKLTAKHCAGGLNVGTGAFNISPESNRESRNMEYTIDGAATTSLGYGDPGWSWGETGHSVDGLYRVALYPDLIWSAVNGKIKYVDATVAPQSSGVPYEADPALSLTAGSPVFMKDYRGMLYYCNGTDPFGRIGIGQLYSSLATTPATSTDILADSGTDYVWTVSANGTTEFFVRATGNINPHIGTPVSVTINGTPAVQGVLGSLAAGEWGYGDNDTLGYSTVYVRLSDGSDPDAALTGYVQVELRTLFLNAAEGYRFTDGPDKVYIQGDEIDYTDEKDGSTTDRLMGVTNVSTSHATGSYVTQYNSIASGYKPTTMAFFRDTMWIAGMENEPGILRYGKTISAVGDIIDGDIHDFSDNNVFIIGEGGPITALQATEDRLYVFMRDKVYYIGIVYASTGAAVFDTPKLFTGVYGCPNQFCVTEMEDVVLFYTGNRFIRIGYDPNGQTLIPDEKFDKEILPLFANADVLQPDARLTYNPAPKEARLKFKANGVSKVIKYHKQQDLFSGLSDEDASCYVVHRKNTYFGDVVGDTVWKIGASIDSEGENTQHRYLSGRIDGGSKNTKLYTRGRISGKKNLGSTLYLLTKVEDKDWGAARPITDEVVDQNGEATPLGEAVTGGDELGEAGDTNTLFPYTYRFLLGRRGKDYSFAISSDESGAVWNINDFDIEWEEFEFEPRTNY